MKNKIIIIILLLICICSFSQTRNIHEPIVFTTDFLQPYFKKHGITVDDKNQLLIKNGKSISYANELNTKQSRKLSNDKVKTKQILLANGIPTPKYYQWNSSMNMDQNMQALKRKLKFPIVIKPNKSGQGSDVYANINSINETKYFINKILPKTSDILFEEQANGITYRILIFKDHVLSAYKKEFPFIVGDGKSTVSQLIIKLNKVSEKPISTDQIDYLYIKEQGYSKTSIPPKNKKIIVSYMASGTRGSDPVNVNIKYIHPENIKMFKKINRIMGLDLNGLDYMTPSLSVPYYINGNVLETNSAPGIEFHYTEDPKSIDKFVSLIDFNK